MSFSLSGALSLGLGALLPQELKDSFQFGAGPYPPSRFVVAGFTGDEALSSTFVFDVDLLTPLDDMVQMMPSTMMRQHACLRICIDGSPARTIHGVVAKIAIVAVDPVSKHVRLRARLVPKLWLTSHRTTSRIFQDMPVDKIVSAILDEWNIAYRWNLNASLPERTYATQYQETDLAFIERILAEEGIFYYFEHPAAALDDATGGAMSAVTSAASMVGSIAGGAVAEAAGAVAKLNMEVMVLADDHLVYPPIGTGPAEVAASMAIDLATSIGGVVGQAVAGVAGAFSPALHMDLNGNVPSEDRVFAFGELDEARPESVLLRDYDFRRPLLLLEAKAGYEPVASAAAAGTAALGGVARLSLSPSGLSVSGAVSALKSAVGGNLPSAGDNDRYCTYSHHDLVENESDWGHLNVDKAAARLMLEQERTNAHIAEGKSWCRRLEPGHRFCIDSHPLDWMNTQYVVTAIQHYVGVTPPDQDPRWYEERVRSSERAYYQNRFVCAPATVAVRPPIPNRPFRQITETALVVGPPGEEIHVDEYGRIKVQFHWDLEGQKNDHSSCWLRTVQAWSGGGWGTQFIPRVGSEVLVTFLGGSPDRPLVVGCLPNAVTPVPFSLPVDATRSGLRTQSSPAGHGFNELSFEDLTGHEEIYLHAQKDLREKVLEDRKVEIDHDDSVTVGHKQALTVHNDRDVTINGKHTEKVHLEQHITIEQSRFDTVHGDSNITVMKDLKSTVEGRARHEVHQQSDHLITDDLTTRVKGCHTILVGKADAKRSSVIYVEGTAQYTSTDATEISSDKRIIIRCGESSILIGPKSIELQSASIVLKAKDATVSAAEGKLKLASKSEVVVKSEKVALASKGASLGLGKNAALDGEKVKINCGPESGGDDKTEEEKKPTEIQLKDKDGKPIPHQRFLITTEDGSEFSGVVDKDGKAVLDLEKGGKLSFPELVDSSKK